MQTISPAYQAQQRHLHQNPDYGVASISLAPLVREVLLATKANSLCDYGAGKQHLHHALRALGQGELAYFPYDPAFPEYGAPRPAELVCCLDVLEHIEPDFLPAVLGQLHGLTLKHGLFSIATGAAMKLLPDGRNAHLIQQPSSWWLPRLCQHFEVVQLQPLAEGFWVLVTPKAGH